MASDKLKTFPTALRHSASYARKKCGLVISDWNMQPMTGYMLLKEVRADPMLEGLVFIMVTAESTLANVMAARDAGVSDYIVKRINGETLKNKISEVFGFDISML